MRVAPEAALPLLLSFLTFLSHFPFSLSFLTFPNLTSIAAPPTPGGCLDVQLTLSASCSMLRFGPVETGLKVRKESK